ncbi:hypothetical protein ACFL1X_11545 [Candidatus Hydrogenedentota bacterium]
MTRKRQEPGGVAKTTKQPLKARFETELLGGGVGGTYRDFSDGVSEILPDEKLESILEDVGRGDTVLVLTSDSIGHDSKVLGAEIMNEFLRSLADGGVQPSKVILLNRAVRLSLAGSSAVDALAEIAAAGADVMISTGSEAGLAGEAPSVVGRRADMYEIVEVIMRASKVVTL